MNKKEILEKNELIAEFMGYESFQNVKFSLNEPYGGWVGWENVKKVWVLNPTKSFKEHLVLYHPEQIGLDCDTKLYDNYYINTSLSYHKFWSWLIPVVQKILTLKLKEIVPSDLGISYARNKHYLSVNNLLDINVLFKNVVEFIEWYNKKHK